MISFSELGLNPTLNMLPMGLIPFGPPSKDARVILPNGIRESLDHVGDLVIGGLRNGKITKNQYPRVIFLIYSDGHVSTKFNVEKDCDKNWNSLFSKVTLSDRPALLSDFVKELDAKSIAVFVVEERDELDIGADDGSAAARPVYTTDDELTSWIMKEFET